MMKINFRLILLGLLSQVLHIMYFGIVNKNSTLSQHS